MRLTLFGMLDLNVKAKSPTSPNKHVPFRLLTIVMLLLPKPSSIDHEKDEYHPRIDHKRDNDANNLTMSSENSAQVKEKQEDDWCCEHFIIAETRYDQMR